MELGAIDELRQRIEQVLGRPDLVDASIGHLSIPEFHDLQEVDAMLSETVVEWTKKWKEEGKLEGKAEGEIEGRRRVARRMREMGLSAETIFQVTGLRDEDLV